MNEDEAKTLVEETFSEAYDEEKFRGFILELLGGDSFTRLDEPSNSGQVLRESFRDKIASFKRLAKFEDADKKAIDVLAVKLKKFHTLEQARSFQRNFIAYYLNGSRGGAFKDAALVAFYTDENPEWRFSLVQMHYKFEKGKVKKELTSAKRSSFLVGFGVKKTHTAQQQLSSLLTLGNVSLQKLKQAFSVEPVTKEFYDRYKELYEALRDHLLYKTNAGVNLKDSEGEQIPPEDFAKHLLGQLVFLYFLQKKRWLGAGKGEHINKGKPDFLRHLFDKKDYNNFYDDILTYLLHEALATERQSADYYYEKFKCTIPYLNGGLFEPFCGYNWQNLALEISNDIFSKENPIKEKDKGIFDIFDDYNFTVREDEPLENEVAIDPEMLGKIFENLIPENERKGSGTFYTPREIVYYMCQESLTDYLHGYFENSISRDNIEEFVIYCDTMPEHNAMAQKKQEKENYKGDYKLEIPDPIKQSAPEIDKALQDVRICDPAIGSGAFPVAMMLEITRLRIALNPFLNEKSAPYDCKRDCIENCLYGVDLETSAIDIARLRLWLSLVVDEESFENIDPLPNLDYKIVQANALRGFVYETPKLTKQLNKLTILKNKYKNESSFHKKNDLREKINEIFHEIYNNPDMRASSPYDVDFDFEVHFFEVFDEKKGFDIIIANPPYIRLQKDGSKLAKLYEKCKYDSFVKTGDIYALFYEKAIRLLRQGGVFAYITSNKWMRTDYGKKIRGVFTSKTTPLVLLDLGSNAFDTATVDTNILITRKVKSLPKNPFRAATLHEHKNQDLYQYMRKVEKIHLPENDQQWLILSEAERNLLQEIESKGKTLKNLDVEINSGVNTGNNEVFAIDSKTRNKLIADDPKSEEILKPALRGKNMKKWHPVKQDKWLIASHNGYAKIPRIDIVKDYPAIHQWLLQCEEESKHREGGKLTLSTRTAKGKHWTNLRSCAYQAEFGKEKIIYPELNQGCSFIYDVDNYYLLNSAYMLNSDSANLKNLTAFLNSNISQFWLSHNCTNLGNRGIRMLAIFMNKLPIYKEINDCHELGEITDAITDAITKGEDIQKHEARLNQILYDLYELTDAEIEILEKTTQSITT